MQHAVFCEPLEQITVIGRNVTVISDPDVFSSTSMCDVVIDTEIDSPEWVAILRNPAPRPSLSRLLDQLEQGLKENPNQFPERRPEDI
jgi:hypothetical protein